MCVQMPPKKKPKPNAPKKGAAKRATPDPMAVETEGGMWDRLPPCPVRKPCRTDDVPDPMAVVAAYIVRDSNGNSLRIHFTAADVQSRVLLPQIVCGTREVVAQTPPQERTYVREGLVRGADTPSEEFEGAMRQGFNDMAGTLWVVPYLTDVEIKEWLKNPSKFKTEKMTQRSWLDDPSRTWWVLDGATRRQLCVKYTLDAVAHVAYPDIAYDEAWSVAIHRNEGSTHQVNATTNLDKALRVRQLTSDKMRHDNVVKLLQFWKVTKSRVSRFNQWTESFLDETGLTFLEREKARTDDKRFWHEAIILSPMYKRMSPQQRFSWMTEVENAPKTAHFDPAYKQKNCKNWVTLFYLRSCMHTAAVDKLKAKVLPKRGDLAAYKGDTYFEDLALQLMDESVNKWLSAHMTAKCSAYNERSAHPDTTTLSQMAKHAVTVGLDAWLKLPHVKKETDKVCPPPLLLVAC